MPQIWRRRRVLNITQSLWPSTIFGTRVKNTWKRPPSPCGWMGYIRWRKNAKKHMVLQSLSWMCKTPWVFCTFNSKTAKNHMFFAFLSHWTQHWPSACGSFSCSVSGGGKKWIRPASPCGWMGYIRWRKNAKNIWFFADFELNVQKTLNFLHIQLKNCKNHVFFAFLRQRM